MLYNKLELAKELNNRINKILVELKESLTYTQDLIAKQYNDKHKALFFKVSNLVFLNTKNLKTIRPYKKLGLKRVGLFLVIKTISSQAYRLKLLDAQKIHDVFYVALLTKYLGLAKGFREKEQEEEEPGSKFVENDNREENKEQEIEQILDLKFRTRQQKLYYLVKQKGQSDEHN